MGVGGLIVRVLLSNVFGATIILVDSRVCDFELRLHTTTFRLFKLRHMVIIHHDLVVLVLVSVFI